MKRKKPSVEVTPPEKPDAVEKLLETTGRTLWAVYGKRCLEMPQEELDALAREVMLALVGNPESGE